MYKPFIYYLFIFLSIYLSMKPISSRSGYQGETKNNLVEVHWQLNNNGHLVDGAGQNEPTPISAPTWMDGAMISFSFLSLCHPKLIFFLCRFLTLDQP
jgi:hypothetical protein